jgi:acetylornithine deacetylase/succinyl-diaminopimelate desuccinylase-like protein
VDWKFTTTDPYEGTKLDLKNDYVQKAVEVMEKSFSVKPAFKFSGGGLPIITYFNDILKLNNVLVPLGNDDCRMHAIDENFRVEYIEKGLDFSNSFFKKT